MNGRYDTVCEIHAFSSDNVRCFLSSGKAKLHPKKQLSRVVGKKVALTKAMVKRIKVTKNPDDTTTREIIWRLDKATRTTIWTAFWDWVESWNPEVNESNRLIRLNKQKLKDRQKAIDEDQKEKTEKT
jgi:hypothetical protein